MGRLFGDRLKFSLRRRREKRTIPSKKNVELGLLGNNYKQIHLQKTNFIGKVITNR